MSTETPDKVLKKMRAEKPTEIEPPKPRRLYESPYYSPSPAKPGQLEGLLNFSAALGLICFRVVGCVVTVHKSRLDNWARPSNNSPSEVATPWMQCAPNPD